jgi:hypothetical protein
MSDHMILKHGRAIVSSEGNRPPCAESVAGSSQASASAHSSEQGTELRAFKRDPPTFSGIAASVQPVQPEPKKQKTQAVLRPLSHAPMIDRKDHALVWFRG